MKNKSFYYAMPFVVLGLVALVLNNALIGIILIVAGVVLGSVLSKKSKK